jgi:hypothetical protein
MTIIRASKEKDMVRHVNDCLSLYFDIQQEVCGTHIIGNRKRIDMVLHPKEILNNFPKIPVGLEIKTNILDDGNKKQIIELYHQAIQYRHTKFELANGSSYLPMILIYPPMDNYLRNAESEFNKGFQHLGTRLAGKFFIGELFLDADDDVSLFNNNGFRIRMCGSDYYKFNGSGKRFNLQWGFEKYEEEKQVLLSQNLSASEYELAINHLTEKLGI